MDFHRVIVIKQIKTKRLCVGRLFNVLSMLAKNDLDTISDVIYTSSLSLRLKFLLSSKIITMDT